MRHSIILFVAVLICSVVWGQTPAPSNAPSNQPSTPDNNMSGMSNHDMSNMKDMPMSDDKDDSAASAHVMHSMEGHMDMGPHMKMTGSATTQAGRYRPRAAGRGSRAQDSRQI
jgi:hypothetical protein